MENEPNKGGRPKLIETDEFKAAVQAEVQALLPKLAAEIAAARSAAGTKEEAGDPDKNWMRELAMAMAEISDQGTNRKRVAPEILAKRVAARDKMMKLLIETRAQKLKPDYRLVALVQLNDPKTGPRLIQPFRLDKDKRPVPVEIIWYGVPNEAMKPLNEPAKAIYRAFMESIGGVSDAITEGKFAADMRAISVTQGGLVVKGEMSGQRRTVSNFGDPVDDEIQKMDLEIEQEEESLIEEKTLNDPSREFVPVLGTVHPPARQSSAPGQK